MHSKHQKFWRRIITALLGVLAVPEVRANPQGLTVQSGTATTTVNGSQLNVAVSGNAFLNWQSFNIGAGETTTFQQPSSTSIVWNRINDQNPSQIYGNLTANGIVVLMNHAGFYFGPNAFVKAAGFVVTTAPVGPIESGGGMFWQFNGLPPEASIINNGFITTAPGGPVFFIAQRIENHGSIITPEGSIGLYAGKDVTVSERPDGRGLSATVNLPAGSVDNTGQLIADAGTIALNARVVNQNGLVQADSVREKNGIIELVASEAVNLGDNSIIAANGDATAISSGGQITIKSDNAFTDSASSKISVAGGGPGGNGGVAEISANDMPAIHSRIDGHAIAGATGGHLLIDPLNITIGNSGSGSAGSGTVVSGGAPASGTLSLNVNSAFSGFSQIDLQAKNNITVSAAWDLDASTGLNLPGSLLKLEAGNNITIGSTASILAGNNWSVTLEAGRDFTLPGDAVTAGVGNITFSGSSFLQTQDGNINLLAGNNVSVGTGGIRTMGGGNIKVTAVSGTVNTGTSTAGYDFHPGFYAVDASLGGISTGNGGDVTINAGQDIISSLPNQVGGAQTDAGSGAFGSAPGNVTLTAGGNVEGHYVVANGTGIINAGVNAGISTKLLALSLIDGGWTVNAAQDILLQEVRNPNGIFNNLGLSTSPTKHFFDYAPDAYTILNAGNAVELRGNALPRNSGTFETGITPIYAPILEITAGAGGVTLFNDLTLFPSAVGQLEITTTDGGSLTGAKAGDLTQLIVSDSSKTQYKLAGDFGISDHADVPLHLDDFNPVQLNISGDLTSILLGVPKAANITVGGNLVNSRFDGQNLHGGDVTSIRVTGDIINRNEFTSVPVDSAPDFTAFNNVYPPLTGTLAGLQNNFSYDASTKTLTFEGRMNNDQLQTLLNLQVQVLDQLGQPVLDAQGNPVTKPVQFASPDALQELYANSQDIPSQPDTGYRLGGGGQFDISAHNLDLGATVGIVSQGPRGNPTLDNYFEHGADINVNLTGDLDMFSTTISSLNGGNIFVSAAGTVNVGSTIFTGNDAFARGIFTAQKSDVTLIAGGNIDLNGSRVAAYDGGNVFVESLHGNVDAGTGGNGSVTVEEINVNPLSHAVTTSTETIPGSGILATTFPDSLDSVGNILVETPQGNINASAGGIVQIPLNGNNNNSGTVTLLAGTRNPDGSVQYVGNIDASGSGVIGSNVKLDATGDIIGVVFARNNIDINAVQNVNVTAFAQGDANVSAGGDVSGTVIGIGSVTASGSTVDASLLSQNVTASGDVTSSQVGFSQGTAANSTSQGLQNDDTEKKAVAAGTDTDDQDLKKKGGNGPLLAKSTGRVTVISPLKTN